VDQLDVVLAAIRLAAGERTNVPEDLHVSL
jgi:hypothetical protein